MAEETRAAIPRFPSEFGLAVLRRVSGAIRERTDIGVLAASLGVGADCSGKRHREYDHEKADDCEAASKNVHGSVR